MSINCRSLTHLFAALSLLAATACADDATAPRRSFPHPATPPARQVVASSNAAAMLSIEVSAVDLRSPLLYDIPLDAGSSSASLSTPAGESRSLVVQAYDVYGNLTHQGRAALPVVLAGANRPLSVSLTPVVDGSVLSATIDVIGEKSSVPARMVIQMKATELYEGQTAPLSAYAVDDAGNRLEVSPLDVHWAVSDPRAGRITTDSRGSATYAASAATIQSQISVVWKQNIGQIGPLHNYLDPYVQVAAGYDFTCGRRWSGRVYCWGDDANSQLGHSASQTCFAPSTNDPCNDRAVPVQGGRTYTTISAGRAFVCGIEAWGSASCWGKNDKAQLGIGSIGAPVATPTTLSAMANGSVLTFSSIATGGEHACGLVPSLSGMAVCWGSNSIGQLGDGNPGYFTFNPMQQANPVQVAGSQQWSSIAAGKEHTCAVTTGGIGMCWGSNYYGELGNGPSTATVPIPNQLNFPISPALTLVSSGPDAYGTCFFQPVAYCDGANSRGEAGIGASSLVVRQPIHVWASVLFTTIALGTQHACAVDGSQNLYCWGDNTDGQIGMDPLYQYFLNHPQQVGSLQFSSVTSGGNHSCAVSVAGQIFCWGRNDRGQLGIGSHGQGNHTYIPTLIAP